MAYDDFTYVEKKALLRSALLIAGSTGRIDSSQSIYLRMLIVMLDGSQQLLDDAKAMWNMNMRRTIKSMGSSKKESVAYVWYKAVCGQSYISAVDSFLEFPEYVPFVKKLAKQCEVDISKYL